MKRFKKSKLKNLIIVLIFIGFFVFAFERKVKASSIDFALQTEKSGLARTVLSGTADLAPTIESIEPNGNVNWAKLQSVVVTVKDDVTADDAIVGTYTWQNAETADSEESGRFINGQAITKSTGTGKFNLFIVAQDEAGNSIMQLSKPFYIDNSITKMGDVKITRNTKDGAIYKLTQNQDGVLEGKYTNDNLYLTKIDGEDAESGHKSTTYQVYQILESGETRVVGTPTTEDTIIENDGIYKIIVTTKDNVNNQQTKEMIIKKGANKDIVFETNGNNKPEVSVSTKVTIPEEQKKTTSIYYAWAKEGEEPQDNDYKKTSFDTKITLTGVNGNYVLWIKTVDEDGNISITKSNVFHLAGKVENVSDVIFKNNTEDGEDYEPDTFTKDNVYLKLKNPNSVENGINVTSTYKIVKIEKNGEEITVGPETNESTILVNEGKYRVEVISKNEMGAIGTKQYIVKIDKTAPDVSFTGNDDYQTTGKITVNITDKGIDQSGINLQTARYYWTRNDKTPTQSDFYGTEEGGFRGSINGANQTLALPKGVSGIWCLWICVEDSVGNVMIKSNITITSDGNISYMDNENPIPGEIIFKEVEGDTQKDYTPGTYTKHNVLLKLINGYDADSGVKTNTYEIKKNNTTIKTGQTEDALLEETGSYKIIVTTTDNKSNKATREYEVKIDKNGPQITLKPDGNNEYAQTHEVEIICTEPQNESGVNTSKTSAIWIVTKDEYDTLEKVMNKMEEIINQLESEGKNIDENLAEALKENDIELFYPSLENGRVTTPQGVTGNCFLLIYAEDILGNESQKFSQNPYKVDNTNPTKPEIRGVIESENKQYYGELTNKEVSIIAENSSSLSGVDKYQVSILTDNGANWSEYQDATITEDGKVQGKIKINQHGKTIVKFRSVAELLDGTLISEETKQFVVNIDNKGPEVTFANYWDGQNGSTNLVQKILVRATVTDEGAQTIQPNTLKYEWIRFNSILEFTQWQNSNPTLEQAKAKMTDNARVFVNGEELPSPDGAEGIYSMFVYAQDSVGNETVAFSNYYYLGINKNGDSYEIYGEYIKRVNTQTNKKDFIEKLKQIAIGKQYRVLDKDDNEIEDDSAIIKTGYKVQIDETVYKIAVIGDLNSDGNLDVIDLSRMLFHLSEITNLTEEYKVAADINNDKAVDVIDLSRMMQMIVGNREN